MLEEERNLLINFEAVKKYRVIQTGSTINFPTNILMGIANNISEIRQKTCFIKAEADLTKYCNSLKKVETLIKQLLIELNEAMEALNLEMIMPDEIPGIIAANIGKFFG